MLILSLPVEASCQPVLIKPPAYDLLFCAEQAVYATSVESDGEVRLRKILDLPKDATCPVWPPDGKLTLLYRFMEGGASPPGVVEDSLSFIERQSGTMHEVYRFGSRDAEWAARWLPDGTSLLIASARNYHGPEGCSVLFAERNINGTDCWGHYADMYLADIHLKDTSVRFERLTDMPAYRLELLWSPDGQRVTYTRDDWEAGGVVAQNLDILDLKTHNVITLIDGITDKANRSLNVPLHWSPKGDGLLFKTMQPSKNLTRYLAVDVENWKIHPVIPEDAELGYWSPSGRRIAWKKSGDTLGITNVESGQSQEWQISKGCNYLIRPSGWSPDSRRFVWTEWSQDGDGNALRMVDVASSEVITLTPLLAHSWAWSPDGTWLAFSVRTPIEPDRGKYQNDIWHGSESV